jgi:hypothetical protein
MSKKKGAAKIAHAPQTAKTKPAAMHNSYRYKGFCMQIPENPANQSR